MSLNDILAGGIGGVVFFIVWLSLVVPWLAGAAS